MGILGIKNKPKPIFCSGSPVSKTCLPALHSLLQYYLSIALSSATAERSFSAMRRVKTWERSVMGANALTNRMFAVIHCNIMDDFDVLLVAKEFIERCNQRLNYFGRF